MATYDLGCCDSSGQLCGHSYPIGEPKNRVFDPVGVLQYKTNYGAPIELLFEDKLIDELTYLRFGPQYCLTDDERKYVKKLAKKGGHKLKEAESYGVNYGTIVIQVAARTRHGDAIGARYFGDKSKYNRTGMPDMFKSYLRAISGSIDIGCQQVREIVEKKKHIKKVIFMTSSQDIIKMANNVWAWHAGGYPAGTLPVGASKDDVLMLHHNIMYLEAANGANGGIEVKFWLVNQEFLSGPIFDADCRFDDLHNIPTNCRWDSVNNMAVPKEGDYCTCGDCMFRTQKLEVLFAGTGKTCCDCGAARALLVKYGSLKAGDQFPLTNNAGMDVKLTLKADAISTKTHKDDVDLLAKMVAEMD